MIKKTTLHKSLCTLVFMILSLISFSQNTIKVKGKLTDDKNLPLEGVSVQEKGTTNATSTKADGSFQLSVASSRSVLVFTYVGYEAQEITMGNKTELAVSIGVAGKLTTGCCSGRLRHS